MIRSIRSVSPLRWTVAAFSILAAAGTASADLRSFENTDGYQPFLNMVQNYNAGQYGTTNGYGGGPTPITPNTGLWTAVQGGFFSGGAVSYVTGHQNYDRSWVNNSIGVASNQALVLTTGHEGWSGPALEYNYAIDAPDLDGNAPASTGSSVVKLSFWWRGALAGPELGGAVPDGYYGDSLTFRDSANNDLFTLGLTQRAAGDKVTYWNGSTLTESTIVANSGLYDRWDLTFDLVNDTVSADYFSFASSTLTTLITNAPMMNSGSDLSAINFRTSPGVNNAKLFSVDDFDFIVIPSPGTAGVMALGMLAALRRRRTA